MADFSFGRKRFDGAYCTVDTFRHLLSAQQARSHLQAVAYALKKNALYVLGLHLLPNGGPGAEVVRWQASRGRLSVNTTMTVLDINRRRREETLRVHLRVVSGDRVKRFRSEYRLRTYTLGQFHDLLRAADCFSISEVYDHSYDTGRPVRLNGAVEDVVFLLRKRQ